MLPSTLPRDDAPAPRGTPTRDGPTPLFAFGWLLTRHHLMKYLDPQGRYGVWFGDLESDVLMPKWSNVYAAKLGPDYYPRFIIRKDSQIFLQIGSNKTQRSLEGVARLDLEKLLKTYKEYLEGLPDDLLGEPQWYRFPIPYDPMAMFRTSNAD